MEGELTVVLTPCGICGHCEDAHVPPCPPTAECGGDEFAYCLDCWEIDSRIQDHEYAERVPITGTNAVTITVEGARDD